MYKAVVKSSKPQSLWMLSDSSPFHDATGQGVSASMSSGSASYAASVVKGELTSLVCDSANVVEFPCKLFKQGRENRPFALEAWVMPIARTTTGPQKILSRSGSYDGITIDGTVISFSTEYVTYGTAVCSFDIMVPRLVHIVAVHGIDANQLWINGELVDSVELTDDQRADTFVADTDFLYAGTSASDQGIVIGGVAIYPVLSGDDIQNHATWGSDGLSRRSVYTQYGGVGITLDPTAASPFFEYTWADRESFEYGQRNDVNYDTDVIVPSMSGDTSVAGSWECAVPLDATGEASIYGVIVMWEGRGIQVDTSLDGVSWTPATNGRLASGITPPYNPDGVDLSIRVSFPGGIIEDPAYLSSITVMGLVDGSLESFTERAVTMAHPASLGIASESEFSDWAGVATSGGTLTVGIDSSPEPIDAATLEVWVKVVSGSFTSNFTGTSYRNGQPWTSAPVGEWSLIHIVHGSAFSGDITISGDVIVGGLVLYPTSLSASDIEAIYESYVGARVARYEDPGVVGVSTVGTPASVYSYDWSISGAG